MNKKIKSPLKITDPKMVAKNKVKELFSFDLNQNVEMFANDLGYNRMVVFAEDSIGGVVESASYGTSDPKALFNVFMLNYVKDLIAKQDTDGFGCPSESPSVTLERLLQENEELKKRIIALEKSVHRAIESPPTSFVVQMVEHERNWGSRPDGFAAFANEAAAEVYIKERTSHRIGRAPDNYIEYEKVGLWPTSFQNLDLISAAPNGFIYIDNAQELRK